MKLFRREAVEHHARGGVSGDVLHITPRALFWTHWMMLAGAGAAVWFGFVGQVDEYATGPAVVRIEGQLEITAPSAAVISEITVRPGQRVRAGQVLVRMFSSQESAELQSVERELDTQLAKLLRDPGDRVARESLVSLRTRRDLARARLEHQSVRAPEDGVVGDVRIQAGQLVEPGMAVLTLETGAQRVVVTALLPGQYRPRLHAGQTLRVRLSGFARETHALSIERVGSQLMGPSEAARYLGRDFRDTLAIQGPVVLVHARIAGTQFLSEGERYDYFHGMQAVAETAVRHENVAYALIPGLKQVVDNVW